MITTAMESSSPECSEVAFKFHCRFCPDHATGVRLCLSPGSAVYWPPELVFTHHLLVS